MSTTCFSTSSSNMPDLRLVSSNTTHRDWWCAQPTKARITYLLWSWVLSGYLWHDHSHWWWWWCFPAHSCCDTCHLCRSVCRQWAWRPPWFFPYGCLLPPKIWHKARQEGGRAEELRLFFEPLEVKLLSCWSLSQSSAKASVKTTTKKKKKNKKYSYYVIFNFSKTCVSAQHFKLPAYLFLLLLQCS